MDAKEMALVVEDPYAEERANEWKTFRDCGGCSTRLTKTTGRILDYDAELSLCRACAERGRPTADQLGAYFTSALRIVFSVAEERRWDGARLWPGNDLGAQVHKVIETQRRRPAWLWEYDVVEQAINLYQMLGDTPLPASGSVLS